MNIFPWSFWCFYFSVTFSKQFAERYSKQIEGLILDPFFNNARLCCFTFGTFILKCHATFYSTKLSEGPELTANFCKYPITNLDISCKFVRMSGEKHASRHARLACHTILESSWHAKKACQVRCATSRTLSEQKPKICLSVTLKIEYIWEKHASRHARLACHTILESSWHAKKDVPLRRPLVSKSQKSVCLSH